MQRSRFLLPATLASTLGLVALAGCGPTYPEQTVSYPVRVVERPAVAVVPAPQVAYYPETRYVYPEVRYVPAWPAGEYQGSQYGAGTPSGARHSK